LDKLKEKPTLKLASWTERPKTESVEGKAQGAALTEAERREKIREV
jgi:hypothetical protein